MNAPTDKRLTFSRSDLARLKVIVMADMFVDATQSGDGVKAALAYSELRAAVIAHRQMMDEPIEYRSELVE